MAGKAQPNPAQIPDSGPRLALRFISGKYQGGEFPLEPNRDIVIGRSSGLDMVLVEEMVSRRHAKISVQGAELAIEDLGSTNGTFVNGEKIERSGLREGDRVLIGTSILKVVPSVNVTTESQAQQSLESLAAKQSTNRRAGREDAPRMSGTIDEIPLPDLLQLFATSKKNGVLVVRTDDKTGRIHLKKGVVHYVVIDDQPDLPPLKAIYRMIGWPSGVFELDPPADQQFAAPLDETVQAILMEGFRQQDELAQVRAKLPDGTSGLALRTPLDVQLRDLKPDELDVLQAALTTTNVDSVFDASPKTDLETAEILADLLKRGYIEPR